MNDPFAPKNPSNPDWDKYFTIEFKSEKGWEVIHCYESWNDAKRQFERIMLNRNGQWRLTTNKT